MSSRGIRATEFEERDYYTPSPRRSAPELDEVDVRRRTVTISPPAREERAPPAFLRDEGRRSEAGPMVLRQRQVEIVDRHHPRSPSPVRVREERIIRRPRSVSPTIHDHEHERSRTRVVERERIREPSRKRSPSPRVVRYVERPRRSPSPVEHEHERERIRTRIVERENVPSPPPRPEPTPPPPPPQVIRGPTIEREVITHWRDVDHGVVRARPPTPPPPPPPAPRAPSRVRERETDIDISLSKNKTEVDIQRTTRTRSRSRERRSHYHDDDLVIRRDTERLRMDDRQGRRRAHSAAPIPTPNAANEEGDYLTSKVDSRGRMGEAWGGATKDWAIVDVPPGTERIRMDGIGGGATDTTWTKYSGVRRTQFIPERDGAPTPAPAPREPSPPPSRDRVNVSVYDREREIDIEKVTDRRVSRPPPPPKDMWTEITKDLVLREAIEELGYDYEETNQFFYIMDYLKYDDVLHLVDISDEIRRARKQRTRDLEWEREYQEDWERSRHRHPASRWDEMTERDLMFEGRAPPRGYLR
ncbi:hypothetical protein QQZ08_000101 [Neonectria magnoliae]|uniref:DUF8035 domain-containing protein n=1 Tax=Neonectria magnoliae TaxID=2732573 RepID=A0ABR1IHQ1_9HYPO